MLSVFPPPSSRVASIGSAKLDTLFDRLVNLETTLDSLKTQQADRSRAVDSILKEMETINENMDRQPEVSARSPREKSSPRQPSPAALIEEGTARVFFFSGEGRGGASARFLDFPAVQAGWKSLVEGSRGRALRVSPLETF